MRRQKLHFEWAKAEFTSVAGTAPKLKLNLVNTGRKPFVAQIGRPCAFAGLIDTNTGKRLPDKVGMAIAGVGWHVNLAPGSATDVGVVLMTENPDRLAPGRYLLSAGLGALGLEAPQGYLRIREEGSPALEDAADALERRQTSAQEFAVQLIGLTPVEAASMASAEGFSFEPLAVGSDARVQNPPKDEFVAGRILGVVVNGVVNSIMVR
jgi:hypothetical protein